MRKSPLFHAAALLALVVCFLLAPAAGSAQTWEDVSKKMLDECAKFNEGVQDMTLTTEATIPSSEGSMKTRSVLYRQGERFRAEITMEGMGDVGLPAGIGDLKTIVINDGTNVWIIVAMMGKSQVPADEGAKYRGQWTCSDYIPADAKIVGSETIGGRDCYVLAVLDESSDIAKLWIDQKSFALMKMEGKPSGGEAMTVLFSDYRKIPGGVEIPYKTEMYSGTDLITTVVLESVEINTGLADDLFDPDKVDVGASGMMEMMKQAPDTTGIEQVE